MTERDNLRRLTSVHPDESLIRSSRQRAAIPTPTTRDLGEALILCAPNTDDIRRKCDLKTRRWIVGDVAVLGEIILCHTQLIDAADEARATQRLTESH